MRCLRITLRTAKAITLPLAYNELIQGMLYACWRQCVPELHDYGFGEDRLRLFTFGPLEGRLRHDGRRRTVHIDRLATFEVRSPVEELLDVIASQLGNCGKARLGAHELEVANLECRDRLLYPAQARVRLVSPVVVTIPEDERHSRPLSPTDDGWLDLVRGNAARKARLLGIDGADGLQVIPLPETMRKRVTRFKGTYVTGWLADAIIATRPEVLAVLHCAGLGSKGSQGFGMFDILYDMM